MTNATDFVFVRVWFVSRRQCFVDARLDSDLSRIDRFE